jgi:hypothetical protein
MSGSGEASAFAVGMSIIGYEIGYIRNASSLLSDLNIGMSVTGARGPASSRHADKVRESGVL